MVKGRAGLLLLLILVRGVREVLLCKKIGIVSAILLDLRVESGQSQNRITMPVNVNTVLY